MNFADYKARAIKYTKAALAAKPRVEGVKVVQSPEGTVTTEPDGIPVPLSIEPEVLDALAEGFAKMLVEALLSVKVNTNVTVAGAHAGPALLQGKGIGTLQ
mgnify:CR=1 FL=1